MIRSKIAMAFFWTLLALVLHVLPGAVGPARAQGTRKDDIVFNSRGIPLAGATVRICAMPATGQPGTPLALIYSDPGLTQALANPATTDGLGNYFFYAAPGKYEIEISGPNITTKQLPNVILPSDPTSPTFAGAISAFSLSLSGNLTVTGNTTVVGNLASGTLNLANQGTPPGAPGAGTVNMYTKTADKRLYYKDETGTEIGSLGPGNGAQTNVSNTFTAAQNIDADFHTRGPNPWFDISRYGGYSSAAPPSTTGTMSASSAALILAAAQDFANGQGIVIYGAGPAPSITAPTAPTVTPTGILNGTTSYTYCVAPEDYNGGVTACSAVGTTASGAATLGINTAKISSCSRTTGVVTCTTTGNHNFQSSSQVNLIGVPAAYNGAFTITATPSSTTFQFNQYGIPDESGSVTSGTAQVAARITLRWTQNNAYTALRSHVYRCIGSPCALPANASSFAFVGVVEGMDGYFVDYNYTANRSSMTYVPATAPTSAVNEWLATTIASGGGTTNLTLSASSSSAVAGAVVLHDNASIINNLCTILGTSGGTIYFPYIQQYPFNSNTTFTGCTGQVRMLLHGDLLVNATIIPPTGIYFEGMPNGFNHGPFYNTDYNASIVGNAYPLIYTKPNVAASNLYDHINMICDQRYQSCFVSDTDNGGQGAVSIRFNETHLNSNQASPVFIVRGGFGLWFDRGGIESIPANFADQPAMIFTMNCAAGATNTVSYLMYFNQMYLFGGGVFDSCGVQPVTPWRQIEFRDMLAESAYGPMIRFNSPFNNSLTNLKIIRPTYADLLGGVASPMFDFTNLNIGLGGSVEIDNALAATGNQPIVETASTTAPIYFIGSSLGALSFGYSEAESGLSQLANVSLETSGTGVIGQQMPQIAAPTTRTTTGTLPSGTYYFRIVPYDVNGNPGPISPVTAGVTVNGSQAVTLSWTLVPGQVTTTICRGTSPGVIFCSAVFGGGLGATGSSYTDNNPTSNYANSAPTGFNGNSSSIGANGIQAPVLKLTGTSFASTLSGTFTANRSQILPDNSGIVPVTSYLNSAYDNATRANGAIGANWTVQQNGLNIASNQIQGTTAASSNAAFWNASSFSTVQFAQATVTALNGTSDFPGVTLLASGSGTSSTYYDCVANTTTIYLQRVVNASTTNLNNTASAGAAGDVIRLEVAPGGALTCYKNGASILTATDTQITSGSPGLLISGNVATLKNWTAGNLHPLNQLDIEADYTKVQHLNAGIGLGLETFTASPRAEQNVFLPGALTSTWTGATWTTDKAVTITRLQVQAKTAPAGCSTNAVVRLTDGTTPVNVTVAAAANDSGAIAQNYAAGAAVQILVQTAAAGCTTSPADANVVVQYRMQ